jgi:hypothetical protein
VLKTGPWNLPKFEDEVLEFFKKKPDASGGSVRLF